MNIVRRYIAVIVAVVGVLVVWAAWSLLMPSNLKLHADPTIDTVVIDDQSYPFTDGMQIPYNKTIVIEAKKDGYYDFKTTLDPAQDKVREYTIHLQSTINGDSSANASLLDSTPPASQPAQTDAQKQASYLRQAAINTGDNWLLDVGNALGVTVIQSKSIGSDETIAYIVKRSGSNVSEPALVVIEKINNQYQVTLGPGTAFDESQMAGLPLQIIDFIRGNGYVL